MKPDLKYIYGIIDSSKPKTFEISGIDGISPVYAASYRNIAALVSDSPVDTFQISRKNVMIHQKVLEKAMLEHTVLPVKFSTVADSEEMIREKVLEGRFAELESLISEMKGKLEVGLKGLWRDMARIFREIEEEHLEIRTLKEKILKLPPRKTHSARVKLGERVKYLLETHREREAKRLLEPFGQISHGLKSNACFGDNMIFNSAFLLDKSQEGEFDNLVQDLEKTNDDRCTFRYVGPVPIFNFVEIVISFS